MSLTLGSPLGLHAFVKQNPHRGYELVDIAPYAGLFLFFPFLDIEIEQAEDFGLA